MKCFELDGLSMESLGQLNSDLEMTIESSQLILSETMESGTIDKATMESFLKQSGMEESSKFPLATYTDSPSTQNLSVSIEMMESAIDKFAGMSIHSMLLSSKVVANNEKVSSIDTMLDKATSLITEASQTAEVTHGEIDNKKKNLEGDQLSTYASEVETLILELDDLVEGM